MTIQEYNQLKAFARQDGALLGVVMAVTFGFFIASVAHPEFQMGYIIGMLAVPVVAAMRLRNYRDKVVEGKVSFMRRFGFLMSCFLYASLVIAIVAFVYFQFMDGGFFLSHLKEYFNMPEMSAVIKGYGMDEKMLREQIEGLESLRPIDVSMSLIANTIFMGGLVSMVISMFCRREARRV